MDEAGKAIELVNRIRELGFVGFLILVICGLSFIVYKIWDSREKVQEARLNDALEMKVVLKAILQWIDDDKELHEQRTRTWNAIVTSNENLTVSHRDLKQEISENTIEVRHLQRAMERGRGS